MQGKDQEKGGRNSTGTEGGGKGETKKEGGGRSSLLFYERYKMKGS